MKKTFKLTHEKLNQDRHIDATRHEIRKYIKRERKRTLPEGADYWDFDCRFGADAGICDEIHLSEIDKCINAAIEDEFPSFYLEIIAKPGIRTKKESENDD